MRLANWVLGTDKWCTCCFRLARCIRLFCCAHRLRSASWARSHAASTARSSRSIAYPNGLLLYCPFREDRTTGLTWRVNLPVLKLVSKTAWPMR